MNTATPNRLIREPVAADPRTLMDDQALTLAQRNAWPVVAARKPARDGFGLAAGAVVALALGGLTFASMSGHRGLPRPAPAAPQPAPAPAPPPVVMASRPPALTPAPLLLPSSTPVPVAQPAAPPVMVYDTSAAPVTLAPPSPDGKAAPAAHAGALGGENEQFAARAGDDEVQVASAAKLSDPSMTVTQGTLIAAVLETAIDTDLPGYARAVVSRDVKSFDGSRVLIPRSSRLIGQYKSGLAAGQTRAYVIWTRLIRPDGVSVALASPAVDGAGRTGLTGKVDSHFMKRFSSAALLTVIGGLSAIGGNSSVVFAGGGQSAASVAAGRDASIPPTIKVPQGQPIRIFTARDLDFADVGEAPVKVG